MGVEITEKICARCTLSKSLSDFYRDKYKKDGRSYVCKKCSKDTYKQWLEIGTNKSDKYAYRTAVYVRDKRLRPEKLILASAKQRARLHNLPFNLEVSDIVIPEVCPILSIKLKVNSKANADDSPSLDRLIPALGYVKGNVAIISHRANVIKSYGTADEHIKIADWMEGECKILKN
jgi:hypothetical protein